MQYRKLYTPPKKSIYYISYCKRVSTRVSANKLTNHQDKNKTTIKVP